jgi:hypothetical protein
VTYGFETMFDWSSKTFFEQNEILSGAFSNIAILLIRNTSSQMRQI